MAGIIMTITMTKKYEYDKFDKCKGLGRMPTYWDVDSVQHLSLFVFESFYGPVAIFVNDDSNINNKNNVNVENVNVNILPYPSFF